MMLASIVLPRPTSSARMARPPIWRSAGWARSIWWGSSLIALASRVMSRSKPGTSAMRSASRRRSYQARSAGGPWSCAANSFRDRSSTAQESSGFVSGTVTRWLNKSGDAIWKEGGSRRHPVVLTPWVWRTKLPLGNETAAGRSRAALELPLLGSNQDSPDPESGVLPVTPRGSDYGAEGARTPDLLGAIQALSQLSYSPARARNITSRSLFSKQLDPVRKSLQTARVGLVVLTLINLFNYLDRWIVAALAESMKHSELRLSDTQLGALMTGFLIVYTLTAPLFGLLGDTRSRNRLLAVGVAIWSLATALAGLARSYAR